MLRCRVMNERQHQKVIGPPAAVSGSARASRAGFGAPPKPIPHSPSAILSIEASATVDALKVFLVLVLVLVLDFHLGLRRLRVLRATRFPAFLIPLSDLTI